MNKLKEQFQNNKVLYERLGKNIVEALKTFLHENNISFLDIYYRVKEIDSFCEKIERKNYKNPFDDIDDICGIRIICYYSSDIEKINQIIGKEFDILEEQDKSDLLGLKEFAYRSQHFIVKINKSWNAAPNYRKLENLKAEVQVRTILMHAWAEIEHKLNYKSDSQVPEKFQRKLFRLSAKFEESDEQFDELRVGIDDYKKELEQKVLSNNKFDIYQDFNIETFKAFNRFYFPDDSDDQSILYIPFEQYSKNNIDFKTLEAAIKRMQPHFEELKKDLTESGYFRKSKKYHASELLGISMDIVDDESFKRRKGTIPSWRNVVLKWRNKIK